MLMASENALPSTRGCLKIMTYLRLNYLTDSLLEIKSNRKPRQFYRIPDITEYDQTKSRKITRTSIFSKAIHIVHLKVKITVVEYTKISKTNKSVTYKMVYLKYRE